MYEGACFHIECSIGKLEQIPQNSILGFVDGPWSKIDQHVSHMFKLTFARERNSFI